MDKLRQKDYKVSILLDFHIACDIELSPEDLVSEIKDQFMIKKTHEQFEIQGLEMDYQVFKVKDSKEIMNV